jgi:hypothetical protein
MILLIKKGCPFCDVDVQEQVMRLGGRVICVAQHPSGDICMEDAPGRFSPVPDIPDNIPGLPALIPHPSQRIYVGAGSIKQFLEESAHVSVRQ